MSIINIKYPNSIIELLDVSYNTTKIMHNTAGLGLNIFHNFNNTINSSAQIYSDFIAFNTSQIDGTKDYNQFGNNTIHRNTDSIGGIKRVIVQPSGINFINNQDGNDLTMSYNTDKLLTNQDYTISCNNLSLNASTIDLSGQVEFTTNPPHCYINPTLGNDLVNKGYVDSLVGQYSGGYNLYFNYSVTDGAYKSLGQTIVDVAQQTVVITTNGLLQPVASFVSSALGITEIPAGLWNVLLYGQIDSTNGDVHYSYKLYTYDGITENEIGASAISADINAINNPAAYIMNITLATPETITLTTKLVIRIFVQNVGSSSARTVTTYFQNNYYSFTQSTLNAGTTLLSSNNTWTGTNNYSLGIKTPSLNNNGALTIGNDVNTTSVSIGKSDVNTNINGNIIRLNATSHITLDGYLGPSYNYLYTTSAGVGNGIGHIIQTTTITNTAIATAVFPLTTTINYPTITLLVPGVYMINVTVPYENTAIGVVYGAQLNLQVGGTSIARQTNQVSINTNQGQTTTYYNSLCAVACVITSNVVVQPQGIYTFGSGTWRTGTSFYRLRAVRIA